MAVIPDVIDDEGTPTFDGFMVLYRWILTSADYIAEPTPPIPHRAEKTVDVHGGAGAAEFNGCSVAIQGDLSLTGAGHFKLLNTIPDTTDLSFTAAAIRPFAILPNVSRIKPVVTSGAPGATGIIVELLVTSPISRGGDR